MSCFRKIEQGVVKIKELQTPSIIDILMEMQSSGTLSDALSNYVEYLIDKENSAIPISVIQKSAIEKPTNNPCISLPDVANQDTIGSPNLSTRNPLARAQKLYLVPQFSGGNRIKAKVLVAPRPV